MTTSKTAKFTVIPNNSTITPKERFLRLPDVERLIGFKKSTFYNWIKEGTFPAPVHVGRMSAWVESDVMKWIENKKTGRIASYEVNRDTNGRTQGMNESSMLAKNRLTVASMALQGLLSNPNLKHEILKTGGATSGWLELSAVAFADALIEELAK